MGRREVSVKPTFPVVEPITSSKKLVTLSVARSSRRIETDESQQEQGRSMRSLYKSTSESSRTRGERRSTLRILDLQYDGNSIQVSRWNMLFCDSNLEERYQVTAQAFRKTFINVSCLLWIAIAAAGVLVQLKRERSDWMFQVSVLVATGVTSVTLQVAMRKLGFVSRMLTLITLVLHLTILVLGCESYVYYFQERNYSLYRIFHDAEQAAILLGNNSNFKDMFMNENGDVVLSELYETCQVGMFSSTSISAALLGFHLLLGVIIQSFGYIQFSYFACYQLCQSAYVVSFAARLGRLNIGSTCTSILIGLLLCVLAWRNEYDRRKLFWAMYYEKAGRETAQSEAKRAQNMVTTLNAERLRQQQTVENVMKGNDSSNILETIQIKHADIKFGEPIGKGTFGKVFRGALRGESVAIKTLAPEKVNLDLVQVFRNEVSMMAKLRHPNIICMYGVCWTEGVDRLCIVLEYASRGTLEELLAQDNFSWSGAYFQIMLGAARGLAYLHYGLETPCVHRDLKPENILIGSNFQAKVSDFGSAVLVEKEDLHNPVLSGSVGSPLWMPPEVLRGEYYTSTVDVYAFGMILLEVVANDGQYLRNHFPSQGDLVMKVVDGYRPPVPDEAESALPEIVKLIRSCWAQDPNERPTFITICKLLEAQSQYIIAGQTVSSHVPRRAPLSSRGSSMGTVHTTTGFTSLVGDNTQDDYAKGSEFESFGPHKTEVDHSEMFTKVELEQKLQEQAAEHETQMEDLRERYERRLARVAHVVL